MIGPVGPSVIGTPHPVRLQPSGVQVPQEPRAKSELAAGTPPVDGGRVAELRAAIAEGRYLVDPKVIAERMIEADLSDR